MRALDLFCGGGGACLGMLDAGFDEVVGIDNEWHPNYPGIFIQGDVFNLPVYMHEFDFVWASPPCQAFSMARQPFGNTVLKTKPVDYISDTRDIVQSHPFTCIENVPLAPIRRDVVLTGPSVGLKYIVRRRHFELSWFMMYPPPILSLPKERWESGKALSITKSLGCKRHWYPRKKLGLPGRPSLSEAKAVMGIPDGIQMTSAEIGEAVPPPYAEFISRQVLEIIQNERNE